MIDQDIIIRMARKAGVWVARQELYQTQLERFAALVAEYEREQCAKAVERLYAGTRFHPTRSEAASAIRARSNT